MRSSPSYVSCKNGSQRVKRKDAGTLGDALTLLADLSDDQKKWIIDALPPTIGRTVNECWSRWSHNGQVPNDGDWRVWLLMAGRGFGKTRAGAEWVSALARDDGNLRIALVGSTVDDVRRIMIEGESGLLAVARDDETPEWVAAKGEVHFGSGAVAYAYSALNFERLRGPQHHHAWCDELAKWDNANAAWDNLMLGLRLCEKPRILVTTTPRPIPLLRRLVQEPNVVIQGGHSQANHYLPDDFVTTMKTMYEGTRWARQELDGELIEDIAGALWTRELLERQRVKEGPALKRIVVGVDPPVSDHGDACGIVAVGLGANGKAYVLGDHSVVGASPEGWTRAVAAAVEAWDADRVVAEDNQGGNMVESTLRAADLAMPIKRVHASRGKSARAEPVAALYEVGRAFHLGVFPELEDQCCGLIAGGGYEGPGRSPDRADALVWAMTELMLGKAARSPQVRLL
jgi:phage terminase large subunit-like protein